MDAQSPIPTTQNSSQSTHQQQQQQQQHFINLPYGYYYPSVLPNAAPGFQFPGTPMFPVSYPQFFYTGCTCICALIYKTVFLLFIRFFMLLPESKRWILSFEIYFRHEKYAVLNEKRKKRCFLTINQCAVVVSLWKYFYIVNMYHISGSSSNQHCTCWYISLGPVSEVWITLWKQTRYILVFQVFGHIQLSQNSLQ